MQKPPRLDAGKFSTDGAVFICMAARRSGAIKDLIKFFTRKAAPLRTVLHERSPVTQWPLQLGLV